MPSTVKVPILGNVPKGGLIAGGLAAVAVGGFWLYRHNQQSQAAAAGEASAYGYGTSAYGYGQAGSAGYYGYGYAYGGIAGGAISPYPVGSEYGYGAFGYGYYNPYTGQYLGGGVGSGSGVPPGPTTQGTCAPGYTFVSGTPATLPSGAYAVEGGYCKKNATTGGGGGGHTGSCTATANGHQTLYWFGMAHGISWTHLLRLNPHLKYLEGKHKPIPKGTKVKVC